MIDLPQVLKEKIDLLDRQLVEAKFTRDHAATPTESHSDKTRQNAEQLMDSLSDAKKRLEVLRLTLSKLPPLKGLATTGKVISKSGSWPYLHLQWGIVSDRLSQPQPMISTKKGGYQQETKN